MLGDYQKALAFYKEVFGPPGYIEGENTNGWQLGNSWITLFPANEGTPSNVDPHILMESPEEVDRLTRAFIQAGATAEEPSDELMYYPVRFSHVTDPFGTQFLILAKL